MLYKFKSKATGDLIMLEPNARQILKIIGKHDPDTLVKGILLPEQMPGAILPLQTAIAQDEALKQQQAQEARQRDELPEQTPGISLRQRATPFIDMLKRCQREKREVVWGV